MTALWEKPEMSEFEKGVVHGMSLVKAERLALLTELRDNGLLEEKVNHFRCTIQKAKGRSHNRLARAIKAHLDELIKSTSI